MKKEYKESFTLNFARLYLKFSLLFFFGMGKLEFLFSKFSSFWQMKFSKEFSKIQLSVFCQSISFLS